MIDWLIHTKSGFIARLSVGLAIFLALAIVDLKNRGSKARRWREYSFLIFCVFVAIIYGIANDQITSRISWEYFYYGKELSSVLGAQTPPDSLALSREAAKIGVMATWSVGLLLGVALLIANNPRRNGSPPPLAFSRLLKLLAPILLITIVCGILGGILGWFGLLNWCSADFRDVWQTNLWRPQHFMCAWGAHLGGYVGGLLGGVFGVARVAWARKLLSRADLESAR